MMRKGCVCDLATVVCSSPSCTDTVARSRFSQVTIEKGSHLRMKIVGTRVDATEIFAICSVKEDYVGVL